MAQITTGRILFGVQFKLVSDNIQCVALWFTTYEEATKYYHSIYNISHSGCHPDYRVYCDLKIVQLRLPDGFEDCGTTVIIRCDD